MAQYIEEPFDEVERRFDSQYEICETALLGEGTYGKVYKARKKCNGKFVALKKMKLEDDGEGVPSTAIREIALLKELNHPNIIQLLDVCCTVSKLVLVFEYIETDLKKHIKAQNCRLSSTVVKNFSYQLCRGIEFC